MDQALKNKQLPKYKQVVATKGPAVGKITGINHLVLFTHDMNECVRFYRDLLGMKIVRTQPRFSSNALSLQASARISKGTLRNEAAVDLSATQVFFEIGNGDLISFYEVKEVDKKPNASIVSFLWPPAPTKAPEHPQKLDHLAFNVATRADLVWYREHLLAHGVAVSDIVERSGTDSKYRFVISIYFSDPSNNPLEIATFAYEDPAWKGYDYSEWFRDQDPAPAVLDPAPLP